MSNKKSKKMILGLLLLVAGLILTTYGGFLTKDAWAEMHKKPDSDTTKISINPKDIEAALMYQTEISSFFFKFKTCLSWTLPVGELIDKDVDKVFNYGPTFTQAVKLDSITPELLIKIFTTYDFKKPMVNYQGNAKFNPTGYNNMLGIIEYLGSQLDKILFKFGSSLSVELSSKIEYTIRTAKGIATSIRLDVKSKKITDKNSAAPISDFIILVRNDFNLMIEKYTKGVEGGFPVLAGRVEKSDSTNGSISVETQFSNY